MTARDRKVGTGKSRGAGREAHGLPAAKIGPPAGFSFHGSNALSPRTDLLLTRAAWCLVGALAVALAAVAFGPHKIGDYFTETDFYGGYAEGARLIQNGRLVPSRYGVVGPGYEMVLALVGFVVRDLFRAAELIAVSCTLAAALLWFHLLRRRANALLGLCAVALLATNAFFFRFGYSAGTDALALALQALSLDLLLTRRRLAAASASGLVAALAFLTRYNAIALAPVAIVALLAGGTWIARRGRGALLFAAGFLAPVLPWIGYCIAKGSGFSFQLHHNIAYEVFGRTQGMVWDEYQRVLQPQFSSLWDVTARDPGAVARRMLFNSGDHLRLDAADLLGWPVAVVSAAGLALALADGTARRLWPLALFGILMFATLVPVFHSPRYSLALLPVYATFAAYAFASRWAALSLGAKRRLWLKPALALVPLAMAATTSWRHQAHALEQLPLEVLRCAETLNRLKAPGDRVIARKSHIAHYAGMELLSFPFTDSLSQLGAYARQHRARWLYFSGIEEWTRPSLSFLLDTSGVVPGLTARRVTQRFPAVLYEIGPEFGKAPDWFANDTLVAWHTERARLVVEPNTAASLYRVGLLGWALGKLPEAREALQRARSLAPGDLEMARALERLESAMGGNGNRAARHASPPFIDPIGGGKTSGLP